MSYLVNLQRQLRGCVSTIGITVDASSQAAAAKKAEQELNGWHAIEVFRQITE